MKATPIKTLQKVAHAAFFALCAVPVLSILACSDNVGLGESVDTEAPTIAITYPPASATIRGTFVLSGTWDDDKGVSSITAKITNVKTKESYPANTVKVVSDKTWNVTVNDYSEENDAYVNGWQLPDGKYELSLTASDSAGHSSGATTRTFEIDNTAPLVVLSSPGSTTNATRYGSRFKIEGTIAEEHNVSALSITVYDENGAVLDNTDSAPYTETSVPTAGGTSVSLLSFSANPVTDAQKRYKAIYGEDKNRGTVPYSCVIRVYDNAREYKGAQATSSEEGNSTTTFFLYDDVYESLMSTSTNEYGLTASDMMTIVNGTYIASDDTAYADNSDVTLGTLSSEQLAAVKAKLTGDTSVAVDSSSKPLLFSLNPAVNPTYTVSGMSLADAPSGVKGQTVTFIVSPGLDGSLIKPATVKAWLLNCGAAGEQGVDVNLYQDFLADPASFAETDGVTLIKDFAEEDSTAVSSLTSSFKLPDVVANTSYVIALSGFDADGNEFVADGVFGFVGAISNTPPKVSFTAPANQTIFKSSAEVVVTGSAVTSDLPLETLSVEIEAKDVESGKDIGTFTAVGTGKEGDAVTWKQTAFDETTSKYAYEWEFKLSACPDYEKLKAEAESGAMYQYTLKVTAVDEVGNSGSESRSLSVDTAAPEVVISSVVPSVTGYTDSAHSDAEQAYVNGTITISGSINEMNLAEAYYVVYVGGESIKGEDGSTYLAHTLNNTCVAPPRMLIAFLENNLTEDGSVKIPAPLQSYMGGMEIIRP